MNVKIAIILFACLCYAYGCNKSSNSQCSGSSNCNHHRDRRSNLEGRTSESKQETTDIKLKDSHYSVELPRDPCNFETYDKNHDGIISLGELVDIFGIGMITKGVFMDLDVLKDDGAITAEEFDANLSHIVPICKHLGY